MTAELFVASEGKFVYVAEGQPLRSIECGGRRIGQIEVRVPELRAAVDDFREGVRGQEAQTVREALLQFELERVIVRPSGIQFRSNKSQIGVQAIVRPQLLERERWICRDGRRLREIKGRAKTEIVAGVRHIRRVKEQVGSNGALDIERPLIDARDRKSTRLNSSHRCISYAVFCLKKKKEETQSEPNRQTIWRRHQKQYHHQQNQPY